MLSTRKAWFSAPRLNFSFRRARRIGVTKAEIGEIFHLKMQDVEQGIAHYRRALEVDPNFVPALEQLERIYTERGSNGELVEVLNAKARGLTQVDQVAATKLRSAGLYETALGAPDRAGQVYREVLEVDGTVLAEAGAGLATGGVDFHQQPRAAAIGEQRGVGLARQLEQLGLRTAAQHHLGHARLQPAGLLLARRAEVPRLADTSEPASASGDGDGLADVLAHFEDDERLVIYSDALQQAGDPRGVALGGGLAARGGQRGLAGDLGDGLSQEQAEPAAVGVEAVGRQDEEDRREPVLELGEAEVGLIPTKVQNATQAIIKILF